jgi:hypothetical protein
MNTKQLSLIIILSFLFAMYGCGGGGSGFQGGGGGEGLIGNLSLTTSVTGPVIQATATYSNAAATNLAGLEITFSTNLFGPIGTYRTDSSGNAVCTFTPPAFNGVQTVTVIARTGNLAQYSTLTMNGRTLTLTPPPNQGPVNAPGNPGTIQSFSLSSQDFVKITDPFNNKIDNHPIVVTATFTSSPQDAGDQLTFNGISVGPGVPASATIYTGASGIVPLPGTSLALAVPQTGVTKTATISWTATDTATQLAGSGSTVITLTK